MIVVFPMLCSSELNPNILPGVGKVIERYLIVHELDRILQETKKSASSARVSKGRIEIKESEDDKPINNEQFISLTEDQISLYEQDIGPGTKGKSDRRDKGDKEEKEERKQKQKEVKNAVSGVSMSTEATSIEPTYMQVDRVANGQSFKDLIGVKVIPFTVTSTQDYELVNMLMYDQNLKKLESFLVGFGRSIKRKMYDLYKATIKSIPMIGGRGTITGDPRHDVVMAKTSFRKNIFVCVNQMELDDEFFQQAGGIKKLFRLGWSSIISLNESQRIGIFCMQSYSGVCYKVPYSYMFNMLGGPSGKYYTDLSDVKKSSAGLFRKKTKPSKAFSESLSTLRLETYKKVIQDYNLLTDQKIDQYILNEADNDKKEGWRTIKKIRNLGKALTSGDRKKIDSQLKGKANLRELQQKGKQINPEFDKCFSIAKRNLKGVAPEASAQITEVFATLVGALSIRKPDDPVSFAKTLTKQATSDIEKKLAKIRQSTEIKEKDSDKIVGTVVFIVMIMLAIPAAAGIIYGLVTGSTELYGSLTDIGEEIKTGYEHSTIPTLYNIVEGTLQLGWNLVAASVNVVVTLVAPFQKLLGPLWSEDGMRKFLANPFWLFKPSSTLPGYSIGDIFAR